MKRRTVHVFSYPTCATTRAARTARSERDSDHLRRHLRLRSPGSHPLPSLGRGAPGYDPTSISHSSLVGPLAPGKPPDLPQAPAVGLFQLLPADRDFRPSAASHQLRRLLLLPPSTH